ncbi:MAG: tRNA pseudouridine(55) synthase TruB [Francisellaceae bacterium]
MARQRKGDAIDGIVVLNKPKGLTSNQALQKIKRLFNAQKAGHTGSLDPMATGVLPICFGDATKISQYLLDADKRYEATLQLGMETDTGDTEGKAGISQPVPVLTETLIETALSRFRGMIEQIPPMYSALKRDGKPLYELARQGIVLERQPRQIQIYRLECLGFDNEKKTITIDVTCSKGTYIRTLGADIAYALGTAAHLSALHRTQCGLINQKQAHSLSALQNASEDERAAAIIPVESAFTDLAVLSIPKEQKEDFYLRGRLELPRDIHGTIRLYDDDHFIAIALFDHGRLIKKQLFKSTC